VSTDKLTFELDGKRIEAERGQTILEAADAAGSYIPRLCHMEGLEAFGGCRMCTVTVNGRPAAACTQPVAADTVVSSDTDALNGERRMLLELLFVEGNHFCMSCEKSGACELQALAYRLGLDAPRFDFLEPERDIDASHPDVLLDHNRCILCARCVRASRDLDGKAVFGFVERGGHKRVAVNGGARLADSKLDVTDAALSACPVGALLKKRVGFAIPVGKRPFDTEPIGHEVQS
jgi:[NiFe] hydrogenase diaphorase moiety small subunit